MRTSPYGEAPFIVIWETTRACDLACRHCRAAAVKMRHPLELTTDEAFGLIDQIAAMRPAPLFVLTGGDPMKRSDLVPVIRYAARERGLHISITPSATPLVTPQAIAACVEAGLSRWAFSLDAPDATTHDAFRGHAGSFDLTLRAIEELRRLEVPVQINTTACRFNFKALPRLGELVERLGAALWSVFFLVPVGRGRIGDALNARQTETVLRWLARFARASTCDVKTTEAPQWYRVRGQGDVPAPWPGKTADHVGRAPRPVTDGDGFLFVSHRGDVYPSGFLPLRVGNVRRTPLGEIYRDSPVLLALRDRERLKGKCGYCEFREVCGGSRARAWAVTGDCLESDPFCPYMPEPIAARQLRRRPPVGGRRAPWTHG